MNVIVDSINSPFKHMPGPPFFNSINNIGYIKNIVIRTISACYKMLDINVLSMSSRKEIIQNWNKIRENGIK